MNLHLSPTLRAIESTHASQPLMQRAGTAAADWAAELAGDQPGRILVLAGPGNNGGDAYVAALALRQRGIEVCLVAETPTKPLPTDAAAARQRFLAAGLTETRDIPVGERWALVIDGLFGIGLTRAPDGAYADWILTVNVQNCPILALDCPSGLNADTGQAFAPCLRATHTLTFIAAKPGLFTADGPDHCGEVRVAPLKLDLADFPADGTLVERGDFTVNLRKRQKNTHKGSFGSVGILGGAASMVGAALLAGRAALHLGAGRVYVGLLDPAPPAVDLQQPELMLRRAEALFSAELRALACGPGLGQAPEATRWLAAALQTDLPLLLDADALNLLAADESLANALATRAAPSLLTPHPAEAARLLGTTVVEVQADRIAAARELARTLNAGVALKGCGTVLAQPDGRWQINTTGNPGMASAGMGDVLSGIVAALLAQGWPAEQALAGGVHLHGAAADQLVSEGIGPIGLTAGETIAAARRLLNRWTV